MKILVVGSFRFEIYANAFFEAFRKKGHQVQQLDTDLFFHDGKSVLSTIEDKVCNRFLIGSSISKANMALETAVYEFRPELVFLYHCYFFRPSIIKAISMKTVVFSYDNDDPFQKSRYKPNTRFYRSAAQYCKINYVYRQKNIEDFQRIGIENAKVLLPYYIESRNYPIECVKDIPLAFVGHWEDDGRDTIIKALLDAGLPFRLYGEQNSWVQSKIWPQLRRCFHGPANGVHYNILLNRVKVALVFFSKINNDRYTRRIFELPAAKTVMLSEYTSEMNNFWPEDEFCVYFRSKEDVVTKASRLLSAPNEIQRMAEKAFSRLKQLQCSEIDRVCEILKDYEMIVRDPGKRRC